MSAILFSLFLLSYSFVFTQSSDDCFDKITNAINSGNASELAIHFNTTIDLTVPEKDGTFSNVQAEIIIKDFFSKNKPQTFKIIHKGSSNDGSQYAIGSLKTSGNTFRIYFLIKKTAGKDLIHQLQIEKE